MNKELKLFGIIFLAVVLAGLTIVFVSITLMAVNYQLDSVEPFITQRN